MSFFESTFSKDKILQYWCRYFPDLEEKELDEIITFMGEVDYEALSREYDTYEEAEENGIEELADFALCDFFQEHKDWFYKQQMFTGAILPIVNRQFKKLDKGVLSDELLACPEEFWKQIIDVLNFKVYRNLYKSIIFEIGYLKKEGSLKGETSEERMQYFLREYIENEAWVKDFYREYCAVVSMTANILEAELRYIQEVLIHVKKHRTEIEETLHIRVKSGSLKRLRLGKGDVHQNGKSVVILEMNEQEKLLYKPHELAIDERFAGLLFWLRERIPGFHDFKVPQVVTTAQYGFTEFVEYKECKEQEGIKRFYERIGELLAVLYSLNSSDIHYENMIACGEYPVLIDLETLIHPLVYGKKKKNDKGAYSQAQKVYSRSVTTIGMLPTYLKGNLEVGGLGAVKAQKSTFKTEYLVDAGKDSVHVERQYFSILPEQNNPVWNGKAADSMRYTAEIKAGFIRVYRFVEAHKEEYFAYLAEKFTGCTGRLVLRPTLFYSQLLNLSLHQEFTRKEAERRLILYRTVKEKYKEYPDVARAEHKDLMRGNIPYFSYRIGEDAVFDADGNALEQTKTEPVLQEMQAKINGFCEKDLQTQLQYIEATYITRRNVADRTYLKWRTYQNTLEPEKWLKTASDIGEYLAENAIEGINEKGKKDASWICVTLQGFEEDVWIPSVLSSEFYSGNAGIAFFFLYLWKFTGKAYFLESAKKAAEIPFLLSEEEYAGKRSGVGAFTGLGGTLYLMNKLAEETKDAALKKKAEERLLRYVSLACQDKTNDLTSGAAGYLAVLLGIAETSAEKQKWKPAVSEIVKHLTENAQTGENGMFWDCVGKKHYCGFAHGSAGIHTYLYLAMQYLGETKAAEAVEQSLRYERSCFSEKKGNWYRSETERTMSNAWCHGAPGILLSKLLLYRAGFRDERTEAELEQALKLTTQYGFGANPTYCHGDLGNMAIVSLAGSVLNRPQLNNQSIHALQQLYDGVLRKRWRDKSLKCCNTYGLFIGLAGWGYALLSGYGQRETPEFLWLE